MLVHAARVTSDDAADVQQSVDHFADLEHVAVARDDVADVEVVTVVREVADRLAFLVDELVTEGLGRLLHFPHSTGTR